MSRDIKGIEKAIDRDIAIKLRDLMSEISEDYYCAGWLCNLEYDLWAMVEGGSRRFGLGNVQEEEVAKLKDLNEKAGGWWIWDHAVDPANSGNEFLTIPEFLPLYEKEAEERRKLLKEFEASKVDCPKCGQRQLILNRFGFCNGGLGNFDYCAARSCNYVTNGGIIWKDEDEDG